MASPKAFRNTAVLYSLPRLPTLFQEDNLRARMRSSLLPKLCTAQTLGESGNLPPLSPLAAACISLCYSTAPVLPRQLIQVPSSLLGCSTENIQCARCSQRSKATATSQHHDPILCTATQQRQQRAESQHVPTQFLTVGLPLFPALHNLPHVALASPRPLPRPDEQQAA